MTQDLHSHLFDPGPKRILALDGGGIRGILTLQMLRKIEALVRKRMGKDDAVLSDYFDLIGGTSTGAIIASALALGWTVDQIDGVYREFGNAIFKPSFFRRGLFHAKFSAEAISAGLEKNFGDITLGGDEMKTGLGIVTKRLDTNSPWLLSNNPKGQYYNYTGDGSVVPNKDYKLRDVVRASAAAPTFFEPEEIEVAADLDGAFVDGGVSPYNNPSLQLLMLATLKGHGLNWSMGADDLLLISLGTGAKVVKFKTKEVMDMPAAELGLRGLSSLMDDSAALMEILMQWMSNSPTAHRIDSEIGSLDGDVLGGGPAMMQYLRYNVVLDPAWLQAHLGLSYTQDEVDSIAQMDKPGNMDDLTKIGEAATRFIEDAQFPASFDPK